MVDSDEDGSKLIARVAELGIIEALITQLGADDVYDDHYLIA